MASRIVEVKEVDELILDELRIHESDVGVTVTATLVSRQVIILFLPKGRPFTKVVLGVKQP